MDIVWGGTIAILLANLIKEKIQSIILGEANLDNGGGVFSRKIAKTSLEKFCFHHYNSLIEDSLENGNQNWAEGLSKTLPKAVYQEALSLVTGQQDTSWREMLYSFSFPKTFIFGEQSLPDDDMTILQQNNINIEVVKNAGHSMAWENPKGLANAIYKGAKNNIIP